MYVFAKYREPLPYGMAQASNAAAEPPPASPEAAPRGWDARLFGEFLARFAALAESAARLSRDLYASAGVSMGEGGDEALRERLALVRRLFGGRILEILAVLAMRPGVGPDALQGLLGDFPAPGLEESLRSLEAAGLVQRESLVDPPDRARYALTQKGLLVARLGEPVLLYLRLAEGSAQPPPRKEEGARGRPPSRSPDRRPRTDHEAPGGGHDGPSQARPTSPKIRGGTRTGRSRARPSAAEADDREGLRLAAADRLRETPEDPDALVVLSAYSLSQGHAEEALGYLDRVAQARPEYPGLWFIRAKAFDALGDPANAASCRTLGERADEPDAPARRDPAGGA